MINEIKKIIDPVVKLYEIKYRELEPKVNYIIDNNIEDIGYIEPVLDSLLNIPYDSCYQLFIKSCDYVSKFNKDMALEYLEMYIDIYGEDEVKTLIREK